MAREVMLDLDAALMEPEAFGPFGTPYLVLRLDELDEAACDEMADKLARLPCPVLGIATRKHKLAPSCDVVVEKSRALESVVANILRAPIAAMTLVQLLRASEGLDPARALSLESMAYGTLQTGAEFRHWLDTRKYSSLKPAETGPPVIVTRTEDALEILMNRPANRSLAVGDVGKVQFARIAPEIHPCPGVEQRVAGQLGVDRTQGV